LYDARNQLRCHRFAALVALGVAGVLASLSAAAPQVSIKPPQVKPPVAQTLGRGRGNQLPPRPLVTTGLIVGRVIDAASGKSVAGAVVTLTGGPARSAPPAPAAPGSPPTLPPPPPPPRVLTNSEGRFAFRGLSRGNYAVGAAKAGYAAGAYGRSRPNGPTRPVQLDDGEHMGDFTIRVFKFASITGSVIDEAGEPVVGASVRAYRRTLVAACSRRRARRRPTIADAIDCSTCRPPSTS
jgi:hypothetical protein